VSEMIGTQLATLLVAFSRPHAHLLRSPRLTLAHATACSDECAPKQITPMVRRRRRGRAAALAPELARLRRQGLKLDEIAQRVQMSTSAVGTQLRLDNVTVDRRELMSRVAKKTWDERYMQQRADEAQLDAHSLEAIRLLRSRGATLRHISSERNVSEYLAWKALCALNLTAQTVSYVEYIGGIGVNISLRKPMDTAERHRLDEMGDLRRQGFTLAAIGARFERSPSSVRDGLGFVDDLREELGARRRSADLRAERRGWRKQADEMRELREANWTLPRIADRYGITKNMAAYRIRRYATKSTKGNQSMERVASQ